jgi:hypothetical protein
MDGKPRLFGQVREQVRLKHEPIRIEQVYGAWVTRFISLHRYQHPGERAAAKVEACMALWADGDSGTLPPPLRTTGLATDGLKRQGVATVLAD